MVKLTRIYTRGGDKGETSLSDGTRIKKHALRIEAIGAVDEANAAIGMARLETGSHAQAGPDTMLTALAPVGGANLWAVGTRTNLDGTTNAVIWHWDGSSWRQLEGTHIDAAAPNTAFTGAAVVDGGVWAVGFSRERGVATRTLAASNLCTA